MPRPPVKAPLFPGHPGISWLCTRPERRGGASAECSILPSPRRPGVRLSAGPRALALLLGQAQGPPFLLRSCEKGMYRLSKLYYTGFLSPSKGQSPLFFPLPRPCSPVNLTKALQGCGGASGRPPPTHQYLSGSPAGLLRLRPDSPLAFPSFSCYSIPKRSNQ